MEFILNIISPSKKQELMGQTSSNSEIRAQQHSREDNYKYPQSPSKSDLLPRMQANSLDIGNNLIAEGERQHWRREVRSHSNFEGSNAARSQVCNDDFERIKVLGLGSFGKVTLVRKKDSQNVYALKEIKKGGLTPRMRARIQMERNVMALHRNDFIVKLHYAYQDSEKVYMVMDYCAGGDLYFHLHPSRRGKNRSGLAKFVTSQVLLAIGHLHSHGIVYRDLKPENVLFDHEGYVKLADFGLSKGGVFSPTQGATSVCGSLHYLAPEVLMLPQRPSRSEYGFAADYFGLGVLLYEMLFGLPPWFAPTRHEMVEQVKTRPLHLSSRIPPNIKDFLSRLLEMQPEQRLGSRGVLEIKSHPYFKDVSWEKLSKRQYAPCFVPDAQEMACNFDTSYTRLPVDSSFHDEFAPPASEDDGSDHDESVILDFEYHSQ